MRERTVGHSASSSSIGRPTASEAGTPQTERRRRVPQPDDPELVDEEDAVGDVLERLGCVRALLRRRVEPRVVEREGDAPRELRRHLAVGLVEPPLRLDRAEADRAERPAARDERRDDARRVRDAPNVPRVLRVVSHRVGDGLEVGDVLRLTGARSRPGSDGSERSAGTASASRRRGR